MRKLGGVAIIGCGSIDSIHRELDRLLIEHDKSPIVIQSTKKLLVNNDISQMSCLPIVKQLNDVSNIGIELVHLLGVSAINISEEKEIPFKPKLSHELVFNGKDPIIDELKEVFDLHGIPLTNPGSKYHK